MSWQSHWVGAAVGELLELTRTDRRQADRIYRAVETLARSNQGDVVKLTDRPNTWRLRVGDWRVLFSYDVTAKTLTVASLRRRNEGTYRD
jgi:mRNA interferase RelE/StbE